ncbi:S18: ribosomal protein S18 [Rubrobacter radiotolerans]|uniref:Small ribosomal subunit protein bS18 n=1 Tax=Rubrobacter radiotolerans TaxID=42256 RepID=A0A023X1Z0_RUBRA|nr:30S ribosomal protein S18 [Rubrobacter radiotolerans]AHY46020.1 S18: ribosomal protein S18 [Rubrobacter radiotolerans]MDX5893432.1 30S ribosomal protein S18 [Rubrobacter radiotolerans]SMC03726.1 small subunit ribosomal protein S18 [Rubrobacter radiotolerans DSM 5868]
MGRGRRGSRRERPVKKKPKVELGYVDYKDYNTLRRFISDRGKIRARRVTGLTPQQQREVATAIKRAREMALLPYVAGK